MTCFKVGGGIPICPLTPECMPLERAFLAQRARTQRRLIGGNNSANRCPRILIPCMSSCSGGIDNWRLTTCSGSVSVPRLNVRGILGHVVHPCRPRELNQQCTRAFPRICRCFGSAIRLHGSALRGSALLRVNGSRFRTMAARRGHSRWDSSLRAQTLFRERNK